MTGVLAALPVAFVLIAGLLVLGLFLAAMLRGDMERAVLIGFTLITLLNPVLSVLLLIVLALICAYTGRVYVARGAVVGLLVGLVLYAVLLLLPLFAVGTV